MGISVLKAIQIGRNSSDLHIFKIFNFIMLKTISRDYEDSEGLSAVLANSEGAAFSDFQQVTRSRNLRLFMLKMISRGYE